MFFPDDSKSIFDPKEIAEVDNQFKEFISNNPYDCYQVLLGQCSIVLISNHPVGKCVETLFHVELTCYRQCTFLRTWADPYARVEHPSESLLQTVADSIGDLYEQTRSVFLGYYTFLRCEFPFFPHES